MTIQGVCSSIGSWLCCCRRSAKIHPQNFFPPEPTSETERRAALRLYLSKIQTRKQWARLLTPESGLTERKAIKTAQLITFAKSCERKSEDHWRPYTEEEHRVFEKSRRAEATTTLCLGRLGWSLLLSSASLPPLGAIVTFYPGHLNPLAIAIIPIALGYLGGLLPAIIGMYVTGNAPNESSEWQNREQNILDDVTIPRSVRLAKQLLRLGSPGNPATKALALRLVEKLDPIALRLHFYRILTQRHKIERIVIPLEDALRAIHIQYIDRTPIPPAVLARFGHSPSMFFRDPEIRRKAESLGYKREINPSVTAVISVRGAADESDPETRITITPTTATPTIT